ncbi:type III secretion system cytoplasmic ring protein SctQ, partial [Coralloluteibacterium thermophilus]
VRAVPLHGGAHWLVEPVAEGWRAQAATEDPFPVETVMDDVQNPAPEGAEAPAAPDAAAVAAALPVQLEFELGRCAMTLGELGALQPGYVFPLPLPAEGANVVVRANGREVARGEVVAVGETLGVRLLNWLGPAHGLQ